MRGIALSQWTTLVVLPSWGRDKESSQGGLSTQKTKKRCKRRGKEAQYASREMFQFHQESPRQSGTSPSRRGAKAKQRTGENWFLTRKRVVFPCWIEAVSFQVFSLGLSKPVPAAPALGWTGAVPALGAGPEPPHCAQSRICCNPEWNLWELKAVCALNTKQRDGHRQKNEISVNKNIFLSLEPSPWPTSIHTSEHVWLLLWFTNPRYCTGSLLTNHKICTEKKERMKFRLFF